jgi:hypothetical protein
VAPAPFGALRHISTADAASAEDASTNVPVVRAGQMVVGDDNDVFSRELLSFLARLER